MNTPTIRELLTDFDITDPKHEGLARRVEVLLQWLPDAGEVFADEVRSTLDGK